jgi:hypothetical protein
MTKLDARKGIVTLSQVIDCWRGTAIDHLMRTIHKGTLFLRFLFAAVPRYPEKHDVSRPPQPKPAHSRPAQPGPLGRPGSGG